MNFSRRFYLFTGLFLLSFTAEAQKFQTSEGKVEFLSKAPMSEFTGKSDKLHGLIDFDKNMVDFYVDMNTVKTGIGLRDRHMRDNYIETKKFPFAEFTGKIEGFDGPIMISPGQSIEVTVSGKFKIHGVERPMVIPGTITKNSKGNQLEVKTQFNVLLGDHDIEIPKVVFYELAEEQKVSLEAILKQQ
ncbi:MAG: YceI family protein [Cyclobacteriaceae bacterium]|nr:YceI family protein [Cyclobacteriaceae bacterium]